MTKSSNRASRLSKILLDYFNDQDEVNSVEGQEALRRFVALFEDSGNPYYLVWGDTQGRLAHTILLGEREGDQHAVLGADLDTGKEFEIKRGLKLVKVS